MKKDIETILAINRYLVDKKFDVRKSKLVRDYLTSKVGSMLSSRNNSVKKEFNTSILSIPLSLLSI